MRRISKLAGVTLLEIMLVLAIAAMIIVMSVRYYQSANSAQQANATMLQIQSIVANANSLSQASGSFSGLTEDKLASSLPGVGLTTAWGSKIEISDFQTATFKMTVKDVPASVCPLIAAKLEADKHFDAGDCADTKGDLAVTYNVNP